MKNFISEEKKQENREKAKLSAQKRRANLSEDQKREAREKNKLAMQQRRANLSEEQKQKISNLDNMSKKHQRSNLSDEDHEVCNLKVRQRRANLSDEERSIVRVKNATQHRHKYQEDKRLTNQLQQQTTQPPDTNGDKVVETISDSERECESERSEDTLDSVTKWNAYREKRNAQSRIYHKARYARLKEAEVQLKEMTAVNAHSAVISGDNNDIQQLQLLANKRQQMLAYGRQYNRMYAQMHPNQHRRWVSIQQTWDEENPCR